LTCIEIVQLEKEYRLSQINILRLIISLFGGNWRALIPFNLGVVFMDKDFGLAGMYLERGNSSSSVTTWDFFIQVK
jgi:hypothetical protein